jgi:hypothetical protein
MYAIHAPPSIAARLRVLRRRMDLRKPLDAASALAPIPVDLAAGNGIRQDGVDAVLLAQLKRVQYLLIRIICFKQA